MRSVVKSVGWIAWFMVIIIGCISCMIVLPLIIVYGLCSQLTLIEITTIYFGAITEEISKQFHTLKEI